MFKFNKIKDEKQKYIEMLEKIKKSGVQFINNESDSTCCNIRENTLRKAIEIVNGDREGQYGSPEDNFKIIASFWSEYLKTKITPGQVADMMILLKIARCSSGQYKDDNYIDICGYAAIGNEIMSKGDKYESNIIK